MLLLFLEALGALLILLFIVWWTMFSGRNKGEPTDTKAADAPQGLDHEKKE
jgi:hypothetical protein